MNTSQPNRIRRALQTPRTGALNAVVDFLSRRDVWSKILLCSIATVVLLVLTFGWSPSFPYRTRQVPLRDMYSRAEFEFEDRQATDEARNRAKRKVACLYENDRQSLVDLRDQLVEDVFEVKQQTIEQVQSNVWTKFLAEPDAEATDHNNPMSELNRFCDALEEDETLEHLREAIDRAFLEIDENGLLTSLQHDLEQGNLQEIRVYDKGNPDDSRLVSVSDVRIAEISENLKSNLTRELQAKSDFITSPTLVANRLYDWLRPQLPTTLKWDQERTRLEQRKAGKVKPEMRVYKPGDPLFKQHDDVERLVIRGAVPLDLEDIELLRAEHDAMIANMSAWQHLGRAALFVGTFLVIFSLLYAYLASRDRQLLTFRHFSILAVLTSATFLVGWILASSVEWRAECIPFIVFAMFLAIAYNSELAIFLSSLVSLAFTILHGFGVPEFVILAASTCTAAMMCGQIRSRTRLVYVGLLTAVMIFPIVIGIHNLMGQPVSSALLRDALWYAGSAGLAGMFMTVLLPFLETWFDVQTDISLLALSDANHPLLRMLVQQAPGTYNHSINVASISEAAAKAIGANGLLCRVGAYFHDIGKSLKPEYFIENQQGENKHDDLEPTMSTIVIIAHVKDGAEMGRRHRLPQKIIDLIEQHHGTTVVEYFYKRALQQCETEEDESSIDEDDFRYPGPKPQSREAAIVMIADSVESACRTLREPAPARIRNLVRSISKKKLDDGQLTECSITLRELHTVEESIIKSLNAMYHGRVRYPDADPATENGKTGRSETDAGPTPETASAEKRSA